MDDKFYNFLSTSGTKMVNINNIALIDNVNGGIQVTLNVTDEDGNNISFFCNLDWAAVTGEIKSMSSRQ